MGKFKRHPDRYTHLAVCPTCKQFLHGEYKIWQGMKQRCYNPNATGYQKYGGRGIKVCERWLESFDHFIEDLGPRPSLDHSLDRYPDRNGDYEPNNCRWATPVEQQRNRDVTHKIEVDGNIHTLLELSELTGLSESCLRHRYTQQQLRGKDLIAPLKWKRYHFKGSNYSVKQLAEFCDISEDTLRSRLESGWTVEDALNTPPAHSITPILIEHEGQQISAREFARRTGISKSTIQQRIAQGWPLDKLTIPPFTGNRVAEKKIS